MKNISDFIVVIPARYSSKRLPGKPLLDINGLPMIIRTCLQCSKAVSRNNLIVATEDKKIRDVCLKNNFKVILTSQNCKTGTDRVAEVAKKIIVKNYINVQGDEPIFNPADLKKIIKATLKDDSNVYLGYTTIKNEKDYYNKNIPKVVFDQNKNLLYASRAAIPGSKKNKILSSWRQVLTYSFPRNHLLNFKKKKQTYFEKAEDVEILRFLEIGIPVKLIKMSNYSHAVDTFKDLKYVRKVLKKSKFYE